MFYAVLIAKIILVALGCIVSFYLLSTIRGIQIDFYWFVTTFTPIFATAIIFSVWNNRQNK